MERPAKKVRNINISFTVTEDEDEQLKWASDELGLTKASYIRMIAVQDAKKVIS